ncbi:glycerophosphodiester phosphodiesterase [Eisenibacter elegans]|jgi:glycerophosphoryl diester phosphodiesterase|uniref:glycerophosphodiester phosphodiesterase n=1 Tax=Eisenibacter elegans TaxID=997 RepID=UPI000401D3F9|nr:glycerophosphodiester phosphodiesterase [Eisenibacter elegans]
MRTNIKYWSLVIALVLFVPLVLLLSGNPFFVARLLTYQQRKPHIDIIAHRGASGTAPENTLAAIEKAIEAEADIIEIDVMLSRDKQVIVIHDYSVDRTTNGQGLVADLTLAQIRQLDAGSWFNDEFKGERIPTLEEVLRYINGKAKLLIELKEYNNGLEEQVAELVRASQAEDWCLFQSFHSEAIRRLQEIAPKVPTYQLVVGPLTIFPLHFNKGLKLGYLTRYRPVQGVHPNYRFINAKLIKSLNQQAQKVYAWTVNNPKDMESLADMGIDGIITNYPALARYTLYPSDF